MIHDQTKNAFLDSANDWVCDDYSACICFIAGVYDTGLIIWKASVLLSPLPPEIDDSFTIITDNVFIGKIYIKLAKKDELTNILNSAVSGIISTPNGDVVLPRDTEFGYYTDASNNDTWFYQANLSIVGRWEQQPFYVDLSEIDNSLRLSSPPFDGLRDAALWLGLSNTGIDNRNPSIEIKINPPVDFIVYESSLKDDTLNLIVHSHPLLDVKLVQVATISFPGEGINGRHQIASKIKWGDINDNRRIGSASVTVKNSDNVLTLLLIGKSIIRRHYFLDPEKARNNRLVAVQNFDKDLKMIRRAVLGTDNSSKFEYGVASLLFLLGFTPNVQLETDSPDLIVQTPGGRLVLVECTLKISDFSSKLGRLVDRKGSLAKVLEKSGHPAHISSALVCGLPRDQIAAHVNELKQYKVILVTEETLVGAFDQIRHHNDPDKIIQDAESALNDSSQLPLGL